MINARDEFLEHTQGKSIKCAWLDDYDSQGYKFKLPVDYSQLYLEVFLEMLNFRYDDGYGCQELFGIIWYVDGTWSERKEYDGAEGWEHRKVPEVPNKLK